MGTEAHNATELVGFLQEWVNSEPALQVDQFELRVWHQMSRTDTVPEAEGGGEMFIIIDLI